MNRTIVCRLEGSSRRRKTTLLTPKKTGDFAVSQRYKEIVIRGKVGGAGQRRRISKRKPTHLRREGDSHRSLDTKEREEGLSPKKSQRPRKHVEEERTGGDGPYPAKKENRERAGTLLLFWRSGSYRSSSTTLDETKDRKMPL